MMNDTERDRLIARYLGRRMSPVEEREFLRLAERDETLGGMIAAERVVAETLRRDRDALPSDDRETRAHLIAALGALPHGSGADPLPAAKGGALAGALLKGGLAIVVAGALTVGYFLMGQRAESPRREVPAASAEPLRPSEGSTAMAPVPAIARNRSAAPASGSTSGAAGASDRSNHAEKGIITQPSASLAASRHTRNAAPNNPASLISPAAAPSSASAATASGTSSATSVGTPPTLVQQEPTLQPRREEPSLRTRDTMRLNVSINLERVRKKR